MSDAKFPRQTAADFHPEVLRLFDQYVHGGIDRRGFLDGAAKFSVGGVSAAALLQSLSPNFAQAQQVPKNDPRIKAEMLEFASPQGYGKARGYLVRPATASGPLPTVLVVHENRGLNPHIEDITRRLALDNFIAFAPDALFPLGGYPGDEDKARELFGHSIRPRRARTSWPRPRGAGHCRRQWQARRRGLLLRRRGRQLPGHPPAQPDGRRAVLRSGTGARQGAGHQGVAVHRVRAERRAHQRHLAAVRGRPQGGQGALRGERSTPARSTASTTTPPRASTRPPPSRPGRRRWRCSTRRCGRDSAATRRRPTTHLVSGIGVARSTATAVTLFCGEPSITRSE